MKLLRVFFLFFSFVVTIPFALALFLPRQYSVEETINIDQPKKDVCNYILHFKNVKKYDEKFRQATNVKYEYKKRDGREGFLLFWKSDQKEIGAGRIKIVDILDEEEYEIHYETDFYKPYSKKEEGSFIISEMTDSSTHIIWKVDGRLNYPTNVIFLWVDVEKDFKNKLSYGLENIRELMGK